MSLSCTANGGQHNSAYPEVVHGRMHRTAQPQGQISFIVFFGADSLFLLHTTGYPNYFFYCEGQKWMERATPPWKVSAFIILNR
jgi:hypothetical protein